MVSLLVCIIILPINITSGNVDDLMGAPYDPESVSQYMFWLPPPPPPGTPPPPPGDDAQPDTIEPPPIYNTSIPPAPPGTTWWQYLPGIPPLPEISTLGPQYAGYGWKYDDSYTVTNYYFTDLDTTTMANVPEGSDRLYAHCVLTWVVSLVAASQFWRYCKVALRLRMTHLLTAPPGVETLTVLCTDIPGVPHGTIPTRLDGTLLKLVPQSVKAQAAKQAGRLKASPSRLLPNGGGGGGGGTKHTGDVEMGETVPLAGSSSFEEVSLRDADGQRVAAVPFDDDDGSGGGEQGPWSMPDRWGEACDALNAGATLQEMIAGCFAKVHKDDVERVSADDC